MTDALNMEGVTRGGTVAHAAVEAVGAGEDMLLVSAEPQEQVDAYEAVEQAVESGQISQEQINQSVERILRLKEQYRMRLSVPGQARPAGELIITAEEGKPYEHAKQH